MAEETTLPEEEEALARLYNDTIDSHRTYLKRLHESFDARCETIGTDAKKRIDALEEGDEEGKKKILTEEQALLDKTLAELKYAINKSSADARQKLEEIQEKLDAEAMDLESELANL